MPCAPLIGRKIYRATLLREQDRPTGETTTAADLVAGELSPQMAELVEAAQPGVEVPVIRPLPPEELLDGVKIRLRPPRQPFSHSAKTVKTVSPSPSPEPAAVKKAAKKLAKHEKKVRRQPSAKKPAVSSAPSDAIVGPKLSRSTRRMLARTKRGHRPSRAELINAESRLGSTIFGPIPAGHRREFFHDQQNIWIWHENWTDADRHVRQMTVRYEVRPSGVYKKLSAGKYIKLEAAELENFRQATHVYLHTIKRNLYNRV